MFNEMAEARERAQREREAYNQGISRERLDSVLGHTSYISDELLMKRLGVILRKRNGQDFLELGSSGWVIWIEDLGVRPGRLVCINISERELEKGVEAAETSVNKPEFRIMDAHKLEFPDNSFDVVFGSALLHHLNLKIVLEEINRVLRPGGVMVFHEPLRSNPVGWLVRKITPTARTADERALGVSDLAMCAQRFDMASSYYQLFAVPMGVFSRLFFSSPDNYFMRLAVGIDNVIASVFPFVGPIYRQVLIVGNKKPVS